MFIDEMRRCYEQQKAVASVRRTGDIVPAAVEQICIPQLYAPSTPCARNQPNEQSVKVVSDVGQQCFMLPEP